MALKGYARVRMAGANISGFFKLFEKFRVELRSDPKMSDANQVIQYGFGQFDVSRAFRRGHYAQESRNL